jgi:hypothetical protein
MIAQEIADRIWQNECHHTEKGLTAWNNGEAFASMGIGHFIWYPEGVQEPFQETFPALMAYLQKNGVAIPAWLTKKCPWSCREVFYRDFDGERLTALRALLASTVSLQADFILKRFESAMEKVLATPYVKKQYRRLMPEGVFAMIDYLNFKGNGMNEKERYQGVGWGLFQVLTNMKEERKPVEDFIIAAKMTLERRVALSPPERNEKRWLAGWMNRIDSYHER